MKPNRVVLAALLSAALACSVWLLRSNRGVSAADSESITWGAAEPTWSPDGRRLAFSLFGSIWQVAAEGGEAEQITTAEGYHAHPAWSPAGGRIVYVSGNPPASSLPRIAGKLNWAEISSGVEHEIRTPYPSAGTPAWSPDGASIVCGLAVPDTGSLLHRIHIESGAAVQMQQRMQRGPVGSWISAAWGPKGEIFFAGQRVSAPQIWSMPAGSLPIMIQLPLTAYRREDIVLLNGLSALPDGSGAIYSASVVNGKGDYELYRTSRDRRAAAITKTSRDEFTPAVSPDGRWIAHGSNQLGNLDLFVMPIAGGEQKHVRITALKFRKPAGRVHVRILDEQGRQTPARLYVIASDTKSYAPAGAPIYYYGLDPGRRREGFFVASGDDEFPAPTGPLRLVASKGVEYRLAEHTLDVPPGQTAEIAITLARWTNWAQRGWYTGENHFHANYGGTYYQRPPQSLRWLEAEDLNTANMIVANNEGAFVHDKEFFTGGVSPVSKPRYVLYWGQEYRNSDPLGHMAFLNIRKQVPPSYTSVIGSDSPYDFPLNTMAALEARRQGGFVSYVHPIGGNVADVFDTNLGAKEAPLTAALGGMDAIDVLPYGPGAYELWYRLLNSGLRILPGAGTDVFTNWRGIDSIPGGARQYVEVGGEMNWDRWLERYRAGRVFVTNAPLLSFSVNGSPMGSAIEVAKGTPYRARIAAEATARVPLSRIELLSNGAVIAETDLPAGATSGRIEKEVEVSRSSWFAVRVSGPPARALVGGRATAHSAPVWVCVGGDPVLVREDVELMIRWLERQWALLEERNNFGPGTNRARARAMFDQGLKHYRGKLARIDGTPVTP